MAFGSFIYEYFLSLAFVHALKNTRFTCKRDAEERGSKYTSILSQHKDRQ